VIEGAVAANLDPAYIAGLKEVVFRQDPDTVRSFKELSIYE
jgi:hypothetical protein